MRAVDVRVGHDNDAVIAQLVRIKVVPAYATTERRDQRTDFGGLQHLIEARLLNIKDFSLQRQNGLRAAIPSLLCGAASGVTLHQKQLGQCRVFFLAVGKLARQAGDVERALAASHLARLAGSLTRPGCVDNFGNYYFRFLWVLQKKLLEPPCHRLFHDALYF